MVYERQRLGREMRDDLERERGMNEEIEYIEDMRHP